MSNYLFIVTAAAFAMYAEAQCFLLDININ
uniref:Chemokine (C-C motif) ligand 14 n=1 Tax=Heterorhabditis bacteriophora TaxID=37862 RepID=A0A1I7X7Y8_HETBA